MKPGRPKLAQRGKAIHVYLPLDVIAYLKSQGNVSKAIQDLVYAVWQMNPGIIETHRCKCFLEEK